MEFMFLKGSKFMKSSTFSRLYSTTVDKATFPLTPFKFFKVSDKLPTEAVCTRKETLDYLEKMMTIRRMETAAGNMYKEKAIRGFCHLYSGQEAIAVGIKSVLRDNDSLITAYRAHGWAYMMGISIKGVLSELTGRRIGCQGGKGGSMHMYCKNFYGGNGIVGAQVPLGAGVALAQKHLGSDAICVTLYGDGAANQGQVFEAYNIAKLWELPCVFICENNKYGMGTSVERASANIEYYTRGDYIPGIWVDGQDVLTAREGMRYAADWARSGKGPILLELETYRYHGHSMSDPGTSYRTREEVQSVRKDRDPIAQFVKKVTDANLVTEQEVKDVEEKVKAMINEAVNDAKTAPIPDPVEVYTHVYSQPPPSFHVRGSESTMIHRVN